MRPDSEADLAAMIRAASGPVTITGGGTRLHPGEGQGTRIDMGGISGITLYEPAALTLVVRAGTPLAEVQAVLAAENQMLGFEPDPRPGSTIGGVAASNASGPRRIAGGACRDAMLGVRLVTGAGEIVKNGGRVMKNVTGYDLVKLLAGSYGALGVLSEVSFRVQAVPEASATLSAEIGVTQGLADLRRALGSPFDVSGAAYMAGKAMLRLEGMAGSVRYRAEQVRALLGPGWQEDAAADWRQLRDVTPFAGRAGAVWRLVVTPTEAGRIAAALSGEAIFDWGGGLIWLLTQDPGLDVRAVVAGAGHATLMRALPGMQAVPVFPPEPPGVTALTAGLRAKFDPRGIFNAGSAA